MWPGLAFEIVFSPIWCEYLLLLMMLSLEKCEIWLLKTVASDFIDHLTKPTV